MLTEVMSRLDRLEASPLPKFVVERDLNLGRSSTTEQVDAPYHSTIGLEEYGGARPKDPIVSVNPGTLRRSERLSHKAKVSYKELESRTRWPQRVRLDSNPRRIASPSPPASPALPRQHEATSFDDTMWATSVEARGGVTVRLGCALSATLKSLPDYKVHFYILFHNCYSGNI